MADFARRSCGNRPRESLSKPARMPRTTALAITLALAASTMSCERLRHVSETPLVRLRRERLEALRSLPLPTAHSPNTPALRQHLRVVIHTGGVDVDSSEIATDPNTTAPLAVTVNAAHLQGSDFRPDELRGGAAGFVVRTLRESVLTHVQFVAPNETERATVRVVVYAHRATPSRVIYKTMHTLGSLGFVSLHLAMRRGDELVGVSVPLSRETTSAGTITSDCHEFIVRLTEEEDVVQRRVVRTGEPSNAAARAMLAVQSALSALEGGDAAVGVEPATLAEIRVSHARSTWDRAGLSRAIRTLTGNSGAQLCAPPVIASTGAVDFATQCEALELVQFELGHPGATIATIQ